MNAEATAHRVETLGVILSGMITFFEYEKLRHLADPGPFMVRWRDKMKDELYELDGRRYIQVACPGGIEQLAAERCWSADDFDLKQYVTITERGRMYLKRRDTFGPAGESEDWGR